MSLQGSDLDGGPHDFVGGGDLHELVERELRAAVYLANQATYTQALGRRLPTVVGDLCQLAGWVASDAGMTGAAERYYTAASTPRTPPTTRPWRPTSSRC